MTMKKLLIVGAGGHGLVLAETARLCGYEQIDFLDDRHPRAIGSTDQMEELADDYDGVIVSIGRNELRRDFIGRLLKVNAPLISLVHPNAYVSPSATVGVGSVVLPGAVIHTNARVGMGCIISAGALIDHDAVVMDFSHIDTGAIVASGKTAEGKVEPGTVVK